MSSLDTDISDKVKDSISLILSKLTSIKDSANLCLPSKENSTTTVNTDQVKEQIIRAKSEIANFKQLIAQAAESKRVQPSEYGSRSAAGGGTSVGGGGFAESSHPSMGRRSAGKSDDASQSTFDRLGGEYAIEAIVNGTFDKCLSDPRIKSFFDSKSDGKLDSVKIKVFQFFTTSLGGSKLYDMDNLKGSHFGLNIEFFHMDIFIGYLYDTALEMGILEVQAITFLESVSKIRNEITCGYITRSELARRFTETSTVSLYDRIGGEGGVKKLIDCVLEYLKVDERVSKKFDQRQLGVFQAGMTGYLKDLLHNQTEYKGRKLEEIHKDMGLTDYEFDCMLQLFVRASENVTNGSSNDEMFQLSDEFIVIFEGLRHKVLLKHRGILSTLNRGGSGGGGDGNGSMTLYDRMGGVVAIEGVVECVFQALVIDPRLNYFFKNMSDDARDELIKKNIDFIRFLTGNGASLTEEFNMERFRSAHLMINITDFHFDTMIAEYLLSCEYNGIPADVITDLITVLQKVRPEVQRGTIVRFESAEHRINQESYETVYDILGGEKFAEEFKTKLYSSLLQDERIRHFFIGTNFKAVKEAQTTFIMYLLGSSNKYSGPSMETIHLNLLVDDYQFDCFIFNIRAAIEKSAQNVSSVILESALSEANYLLEKLRYKVVKRLFDTKKALNEMRGETTLCDRLNGESGLTKIVEGFYAKILVDDRLRSFFEKNKSKMIAIKKRIVGYLVILTGHASQRDKGEDMLLVHSKMNIYDFHYDAALETYLLVMRDMKIELKDIKEFLRLLQVVRSDICLGSTVRFEFSKKTALKLASKTGVLHGESLLEQIGGIDKFHIFMDKLFDSLIQDSRVKSFFVANHVKIKNATSVYFQEFVFNSQDANYKGRELSVVHGGLKITHYHFDCFLLNIQKILSVDLQLSDLVIDLIVYHKLEPLRAQILQESIDDQANNGAGGGGGSSALKAKLKDGKCLLERIGGERNLESMVNIFFEKVLIDPRVKYFFGNSTSQKMRQLRRRFFEFLNNIFDNKSNTLRYDVGYIRKYHDSMNITNYHFDAFIDIMEISAKEGMLIDQVVTDDIVVAMYRIRNDVTIGFALRNENSNVIMKSNKSVVYKELKKSVGGVDALVDRLYVLINKDKRINSFFTGSKIEFLKPAQKIFLDHMFGGEKVYTGRSLVEVHSYIRITDYHFDCFLWNVNKALREAGCNEESIDIAAVQLEKIRIGLTKL
jgi:truncated hemoglobin YjbI